MVAITAPPYRLGNLRRRGDALRRNERHVISEDEMPLRPFLPQGCPGGHVGLVEENRIDTHRSPPLLL